MSDSIVLLRSIKLLVKDLSKKLSNITDVEDIFVDGDIIQLRQKIYDECLKMLQYDNFRRESIDIIWINCFYEPIRLYKSVGDLNDEDRSLLRRFITSSIESFSVLMQFEDIRPRLLIHLGDLHRYYFTTVEQNNKHFDDAAECYKEALRLDPENGHPFNQLALLLKERNSELAFSLFLRACIVPKPFNHALKNLHSFKQKESESSPSFSLFSLVDILIFDFGRASFEDERKRFDVFFDAFLMHSDRLSAVGFIHLFALAAVYALFADDDDEKFRCAISFLFRKWTLLLNEVEKYLEDRTLKEEDEQLAKRRRQRKSSSSSTDSSETEAKMAGNESAGKEQHYDEDFVWVLLPSVFEFLVLTEGRFTGRKLSVSLKFQFQNLIKTLVNILNELLPKLSPKMCNYDEKSTRKHMTDWMINGPFAESNKEELCEIAVCFVRRVIKNEKFAITFDKFFQVSSNLAEEKELKQIAVFSKMHLQHVTEENEKTSKIPVFVAPDFSVFIHKLDLVKQLLLMLDQTVVIARSVLSKLDKVKRENNNAREAIRWIQNQIPEGRVRMLPHTGERFVNECLKFVREKGLLDKKTLFCSILTTGEASEQYERQMDELRQFNSVSVENIADFIARIVKTKSKT